MYQNIFSTTLSVVVLERGKVQITVLDPTPTNQADFFYPLIEIYLWIDIDGLWFAYDLTIERDVQWDQDLHWEMSQPEWSPPKGERLVDVLRRWVGNKLAQSIASAIEQHPDAVLKSEITD